MSNALLPVFQPASSMLFDNGEGAWLTTVNGERYLDLGAGIAVNALGYSHPHLIGALERQGRKLWHVSNVYRISETERLAERLTAACFAQVAFFATLAPRPMNARSRSRVDTTTHHVTTADRHRRGNPPIR